MQQSTFSKKFTPLVKELSGFAQHLLVQFTNTYVHLMFVQKMFKLISCVHWHILQRVKVGTFVTARLLKS